ncbi:hypothetical protein F967_01222 [Acinetobacter sp. CIP 102637]|uniref:benzoate/H(+) symporter BenE family transporter n=1 Tax=Acinetobacter sp. CIP 102637 TaxID=1144669 RepID=UPI0002CFD25D|nr:hypothetical protein F967_01222 [Acinetobacter sp. CIP 102637]
MQRLIQDFSIPAVFAGFITFLIGISVSAVLVIQGAQSLGANTAQISSWFWALGLAIGLSGLILSWKYKYPVATAWSFPQIFIVALAGIALFATISHNVALAFANVEEREAALLTFLCSASGVQFWGIGSAFWGLILGIFVLILFKFKLKNKP